MKFWQKTYILTLLIFVIVLVGAVSFSTTLSNNAVLTSEKDKALLTHVQIENSLKTGITRSKSESYGGIFNSYGSFYSAQGIPIAISDTSTLKSDYSSLPSSFSISTHLPSDLETVYIDMYSQGSTVYYFCVSAIDDTYMLTTFLNITETFRQIEKRDLQTVIICFGASLIVAIILFIVLKAISKPLLRLSKTANTIAGGNLTLRAEVKGKDEIAELSQSFNNMADSLVTKMDSLATMAAEQERISDNLSHEIRTPLTAIHGYAEYMQLAALGKRETAEVLGYIMEESMRLQKISSRMLMLSEMRRNEIELKPTELYPIIKHCAISITAKAAEKDVKFITDSVPDVYIIGDDILIESLINNLCENAVRACEPEDIVKLCFNETEDKLIISVVDTGRGISIEDLKKLGEPFYRPDKARSRQEGGAGLGITLCKQIAQMHGTRLSYKSIEGEGTTVHFILRIASDEEVAANEKTKKQ